MIDVRNVSFSYSWNTDLFTNLSFQVGAGRITGLLGLNGEGKTTLLKLLAGQLLYKNGQINVLGDNPKLRKVSFLSSVFYLPEVLRLPKRVTVRTFFDTMKVFYPTFSDEIAGDALAEFGIDYGMKMRNGSQGQQKKMMLAFAFALRVPVLLLDEPTNGLDIPGKSVFRKLIAKYITEEQTMIISTHQVRDLEQIIDYIMVLQDNQILLNRSLGELTDRFVIRSQDMGGVPLYEESSPSGRVGLYTRSDGDDYNFSTEIFFNGLLKNGDAVLRVLNEVSTKVDV